jgi:4-amino-4-deoxy-L-arabinose transferase-like glycosyltransferase
MVKKPELKISPGLLPAASLAAAITGQVLMYCFKLALPGLIFFAAAAAMLIVPGRRGAETMPLKITKKTEIILFSAVMLAAVFFRLAFIDSVPAGCFTDEAAIGFFAKSMLANGIEKGSLLPVVHSGATYHPCLTVYAAAAVFKAFGAGITQLRIVSAIIGILAVPAFYFLARYLMGPVMALAGAFLLAIMRWHVNFSRIGFDSILPVTLLILVLYFIARAYREGKTSDFVLVGFTIAASQYTYVSARLIFAWLAIICLYAVINNRKFFIENRVKIMLATATTLVLLLPLAGYYVKKPADLLQRAKEVSLFNRTAVDEYWNGKKSTAGAFLETAVKTAGMFNVAGDENGRHNLPGQPMLDFISGMAAITGFLYALFYIFKPQYFFFISFFAVFLIPGLITIEAPQALRTMNVIPAVLFFALLFLNKITAGIRAKNVLIIAALSAALLAAGAENGFVYFGLQGKDIRCSSPFFEDEIRAANYINDIKPGARIIVYNDFITRSDRFIFIAGSRLKDCEIFDPNNPFPAPQAVEKDAVYVLPRTYAPIIGLLARIYPHSRKYEEKDAYSGHEFPFTGIMVPAQAIMNWDAESPKHGLLGRYYRGPGWKGRPLVTEKKQLIVYEWKNQPVSNPSSAEWTGKIRTDIPGEYVFGVQSREYADLYIDGKKAVIHADLDTLEEKTLIVEGKMFLSPGMHSIRLRQVVKRYYLRLNLWWRQPGETKLSLVPPDVLYY